VLAVCSCAAQMCTYGCRHLLQKMCSRDFNVPAVLVVSCSCEVHTITVIGKRCAGQQHDASTV
jgi:hypothetical protein